MRLFHIVRTAHLSRGISYPTCRNPNHLMSYAANVMRHHPHLLSSGMRQRVMIAVALSCSPQLLIADEQTTAPDVTTQAQILNTVRDLQADLSMALVFISHDMASCFRTSPALLRNSRLVRDDLFPLQRPATRMISAVPRAARRFISAMRICISAVWRLGSLAAMRSPKALRHRIRCPAMVCLDTAWDMVSGPALPDRPAGRRAGFRFCQSQPGSPLSKIGRCRFAHAPRLTAWIHDVNPLWTELCNNTLVNDPTHGPWCGAKTDGQSDFHWEHRFTATG